MRPCRRSGSQRAFCCAVPYSAKVRIGPKLPNCTTSALRGQTAATDLKTSAKPDGSHYVINGSKVFSTFSPDAAIFLIYVRYGPGLGGIGSVIVERDTPGFKIGPPSRFMSG